MAVILRKFSKITAAAVLCCFLFVSAAVGAAENNSVLPSSDLQSLSLSCGALSPAFNTNITSYTVVANGVVNTVVTPIASDPDASVTVNGTPCTNGYGCNVSIPLNGCAISVVVSGKNIASKTYTVAVTFKSRAPLGLSGLNVSNCSLSPAFDTGISAYTANVENGVDSVMVKPTAADPTQKISVNGTAVNSGSICTLPLSVGVNSVVITVSSGDGSKSYTVSVTRAAKSSTGQTGLSGLKLSSGALRPAFDPGTYFYTANVKYSVTSLEITPIAFDSTQSVTVNGIAVNSGSGYTLPLTVGANSAVITVSSGGGSKSYTVTVTRAKDSASSSPGLSDLRLSSGTLSPAFGTESYTYFANVKYSVDSVKITPTALDSKETITINNTSMKSGSNFSLPLSVGDNTAIITVSSGSDSKSYTVTIKRTAKTAGDCAGLSGLMLNSGALSPAFDPGIYSYSASVDNDVAKICVSADVSDTDADVKINGSAGNAVSLDLGSNIIKITVKETDDTVITYTVNVFRKYETQITVSSQNASGAYCAAVPDYVSMYGDNEAFTFKLGDSSVVMPVSCLKSLKGSGGLTVSCSETTRGTVQKASAAAPDNCAVAGGVDIVLSGGNAATNKACAINAKTTLRLSSGEKSVLKHGVPEVYYYNSKGTLTETDADFDITGGTVKFTAASSGTYVIAAALSNAAISYTVTADPHYTASGSSFEVRITRGSTSSRLSGGQLMVVTTLQDGRQTYYYKKVSGNDCKIRVTVSKKAVRSAVYLTGGFSGNTMPKTFGLTQFIRK